MTFVDEARIFIKAGDGGKGCESHHREKSSRYPRADGGDGGRGGDIIFIADKSLQTLLDFRFKQHYKAGRGGHGGSKGKNGRSGENCVLKVPQGTILKDFETQLLVKDLVSHGQFVLVAQGGNAGKGNMGNKPSTPPGLGEERTIHLELKIIADVGIVGFPNAGKSTLISQVSKVKSKIANYPFTTKQPILGVVDSEEEFSFIIADLPGLIEGAHTGRGLGDRFLKHAERTKILLHLIDMAGTEGRDPLDDYEKIKKELLNYGDQLSFKYSIVAANKMDLPDAPRNLKRFKKAYSENIIDVSAIENMGLDGLLDEIRKVLKVEAGME